MTLYMVMGMPHSGKSSYIREFLPSSAVKIDSLDFEIEYANNPSHIVPYCRLALESALGEASKNGTDVIFEFPGINRKFRSVFMRKIVQNYASAENRVVAVWISEDDNVVIKRLELGGQDGLGIVEMTRLSTEPPSLEEGFDEVRFVKGNGAVPSLEEYLVTQAAYHCGYTGKDAKEAEKMLAQRAEEGKRD